MVCQILMSEPLRSGSNHSGVPQGIDTLLGIAKLPEELFRILSKLGSRVGWSRVSRFDGGIEGPIVSIIFQGDGLNSSFITDKRIFKGCLKIMDRSSGDLPGKDFEPFRGVFFCRTPSSISRMIFRCSSLPLKSLKRPSRDQSSRSRASHKAGQNFSLLHMR